jgi:hypothetical protein
MRRDEVLRILDGHRLEIRQYGVRSLSIFGSVARDEATPEASRADDTVPQPTIPSFGGEAAHFRGSLRAAAVPSTLVVAR